MLSLVVGIFPLSLKVIDMIPFGFVSQISLISLLYFDYISPIVNNLLALILGSLYFLATMNSADPGGNGAEGKRNTYFNHVGALPVDSGLLFIDEFSALKFNFGVAYIFELAQFLKQSFPSQPSPGPKYFLLIKRAKQFFDILI